MELAQYHDTNGDLFCDTNHNLAMQAAATTTSHRPATAYMHLPPVNDMDLRHLATAKLATTPSATTLTTTYRSDKHLLDATST